MNACNFNLPSQLFDLRDVFRQRGFDLRVVGGTVRDALLDLTPKDVDLHTDATPNECVDIYNSAGVRWEPTGIDHGTITVIFDHVGYEITSLRQDVATDGRRATVAYTRDWTIDLERRDFTINAMSASFEGEIMDPFGGQQDLSAGCVRFVGDPQQRIREDYLRILRWFRFRGRFGTTEVTEDLWAVNNLASGLRFISRERVWSEIRQILARPSGVSVMEDIHNRWVAQHVDLPVMLHASINVFGVAQQGADSVSMLVALYNYRASDILKTWKASTAEIKLCEFLLQNAKTDPFEAVAVMGVSRDWATQLSMLQEKDPLVTASLKDWCVPVFPVTGYDLISAGVKPGPIYSEIMGNLKTAWARSGYLMTKHQLLDTLTF